MANTAPFISDRVKLKLREVAERFMTSTCDIKRQAATTGSSGYNQPNQSGVWTTTPNGAGVKCRLKQQSVTVTTGEQITKEKTIVENRFQVELPYGTDITVKDRLYNVRDRDGNTIDPTIVYFDVKERIPDDSRVTVAVEAIH
ncbi:MAG: hypothetical protein J0I20_35735 [Chloroflexi bacterium]|nr:hypothetical protein [Chloroflexota bacterium]OJV86956.1 MAG: hypothetical protein BGO39_28550 [Chloroflexi bacterium 54-19]